MQLPDEWLSEANQNRLTDRVAYVAAPYLLNGAILSLTGGILPPHLLLSANFSAGDSAWAATWVDRTSVGFATMSAPVDEWSCYYEDRNGTVEPETAEAWSRPLASVSVVKAETMRGSLHRTHFGKTWSWEALFAVHFADGAALDLSPFCRTRNDEAGREFREFVTAITASS